ncbi:hypothetical protein ACSQ67_007809 [Phaseolus vulgaris]
MDKRPEHGAKASLVPSNRIGSRFSNLNKSFKYSLRSLLTSCSKEEFCKAFSSFSNTERESLHRLFLQVITSLHENLELFLKHKPDADVSLFQILSNDICHQWKGLRQSVFKHRIATIHYKTCMVLGMADGRDKVSFASPPLPHHLGQEQAGATLDAVEEIVEEQDLDVLFSDRSNITDVSENLSMAKKKEIQHLMHMVQLGEEHNQVLRTRLQILREDNKVLSGASQAVEKVNVSQLIFSPSISRKLKSMNLNYGANIGDGIHDE